MKLIANVYRLTIFVKKIKIMSTATWNIDASHLEVGFKIRHLMISNVKGTFGKYTASFTSENDHFETAKISFEAAINSISTNNEQRDAHIMSAEFFDAEKFPVLKFESTSVTKKSTNEFAVEGQLTIKDVTQSVVLNVTSSETAKDPWGQTKIAFEANTIIKKSAFGLVWNAPLETGGFLLSDDVHLNAELQFIKA
jgi:polyisoprenoid-binding protein YceI